MNIAVYGGAGTGDPTREAIEAFLDHAGIGRQTIRPDDVPALDPGRFDAFYVPGGWAWPYVRDIAPEGKRALRGFVRDGGCYLGVCAGAYFAADLIRWEGRFVEYDLDLFRGLAAGPIDAIRPWKGWRLTELELDPDHPISGGRREQRALYWGGPAFELHPRQQGVEVLARYRVTGRPATIVFPYGRGRVLLMGCHLELGWDEERGRFDLAGGHGAQWEWLERAVRTLVEPARVDA